MNHKLSIHWHVILNVPRTFNTHVLLTNMNTNKICTHYSVCSRQNTVEVKPVRGGHSTGKVQDICCLYGVRLV